MESWFNSRKAAQVTAYFCNSAGGNIHVVKLAKLIYLSDRRFLQETGYSITNDIHVSMDYGPVNSITRNLIEGNYETQDWSDLVGSRAGNYVGLARPFNEMEDTDEFSDAEAEVLAAVWAEFGDFGDIQGFALADWTHNNCPEWEKPNGSSNPIPVERILKFLGIPHSEELAKRHACQRDFRSALKGLDQDVAF